MAPLACDAEIPVLEVVGNGQFQVDVQTHAAVMTLVADMVHLNGGEIFVYVGNIVIGKDGFVTRRLYAVDERQHGHDDNGGYTNE